MNTTSLKCCRILFLFLLIAGIGQADLMGQCTGGTSIGSISPTTSWQTSGCIRPGEYFTFNATAGNTYVFSYCQAGGTAPIDRDLTIQNNAGTPVAYNAFTCTPGGVFLAEISWMCPSSGTYRIVTYDWPCFVFTASCGTLAYREIAAVGAGATCASPYNIISLPHTDTGLSTCGAGDDYNSTHACSSTFMNGEDFVYSYTTTGPECLDFTIANSTGSHGLFVLDGCPDAGGTSCIASLTSTLGNTLTGVSLPSAGTYYFVVSSQDPPNTCITLDLTIENCPTGEDCSNPRIVPGLPFSAPGETTCGFGDDYDQADACSSTYMNGDDFVLEYTISSAPKCIDIFTSNTQNFTGLFILDDCPDAVGANCLGSLQGALGNPALTGITLNSVGTYYIVVSTSPSPQCTPFDIVVDTCRPPVPCGLNPAPTDSCLHAPNISGYGQFCGRTNPVLYNATIPGNLNGQFCAVIDNNHWFRFVADSTAAVFNFQVSNCLLGLGIQAMVFSTPDCNTFTGVSNCFNPGVQANGTVTATGLTVGNTYYLMVDGNARDDCEYTVTYNGGPLPVQWGSVHGTRVSPEDIRVNWTTLSEETTRGFYIERGYPSSDGEEGSLAWHSVGYVDAEGGLGVQTSYSVDYKDDTPGSVAILRIRQVDLDGFSHISDAIEVGPFREDQTWVNAYPVPVKNRLNFEFRLSSGAPEAQVSLSGLSGKILRNIPALRSENNMFRSAFDLSELPSGIYFLKIQSGAEQIIRKVTILKD